MRDAERVYRAKKAGQAILVCGKCERKLDGKLKVRKALGKLAKPDESPILFNVIRVGCLGLCPKGGVAVCDQAGLTSDPVGMRVIWGKKDLVRIYEGARVLPDGRPARAAVTS